MEMFKGAFEGVNLCDFAGDGALGMKNLLRTLWLGGQNRRAQRDPKNEQSQQMWPKIHQCRAFTSTALFDQERTSFVAITAGLAVFLG